jgi:lambda repressor-like predicted transcriptional regulator
VELAVHREDIKSELRKRHGTILKFEAKAGLPAYSVKDCLAGKSRPRIAEAVARELNMDIDLVFPGQKDRKRGRPSKKIEIKPVRAARKALKVAS